jgi:hypothetical protein
MFAHGANFNTFGGIRQDKVCRNARFKEKEVICRQKQFFSKKTLTIAAETL